MINDLECKEFIGRCYASDIGIFGQRRADQTSERPAWMSSRSAARVLELEGGHASALTRGSGRGARALGVAAGVGERA